MTIFQKKICLLGEFAVGKTSLVRQFVEGRFDDKYLSTIGVKVARKSLARAYGTLNLLLWDLAGSEDFSANMAYLQGAAGALVVCDLTRGETLSGLERYARQMQTAGCQGPLVFLGNKADLTEQRSITEDDLKLVAEALGGPYFLTSAKTGANVEAAFLKLAELLE
jgi:small GTP-binding protein